jgi:hypothetical protein
MTIQLDLPAELHDRLATLAARRGQSIVACATDLLEQSVPGLTRNQRLIETLKRFEEGDAAEQRETGDFLIQALDEDRPSYRKLFPPELEGKTW